MIHLYNGDPYQSIQYCFISITNADGNFFPVALHDAPNVLTLQFDDITYQFGDLKLFTKEQAKQIIDFLTRNLDKGYCVVHCTAGISRSGAVATFIHKWIGTATDDEFKVINPNIFPNSHVFKTLCDEVGLNMTQEDYESLFDNEGYTDIIFK